MCHFTFVYIKVISSDIFILSHSVSWGFSVVPFQASWCWITASGAHHVSFWVTPFCGHFGYDEHFGSEHHVVCGSWHLLLFFLNNCNSTRGSPASPSQCNFFNLVKCIFESVYTYVNFFPLSVGFLIASEINLWGNCSSSFPKVY